MWSKFGESCQSEIAIEEVGSSAAATFYGVVMCNLIEQRLRLCHIPVAAVISAGLACSADHV